MCAFPEIQLIILIFQVIILVNFNNLLGLQKISIDTRNVRVVFDHAYLNENSAGKNIHMTHYYKFLF